jgi:hypothetical protein
MARFCNAGCIRTCENGRNRAFRDLFVARDPQASAAGMKKPAEAGEGPWSPEERLYCEPLRPAMPGTSSHPTSHHGQAAFPGGETPLTVTLRRWRAIDTTVRMGASANRFSRNDNSPAAMPGAASPCTTRQDRRGSTALISWRSWGQSR